MLGAWIYLMVSVTIFVFVILPLASWFFSHVFRIADRSEYLGFCAFMIPMLVIILISMMIGA